MSVLGNISKTALDLLTPDGQTERFTFRKFDGSALANAAQNGTEIPENAITTVILKINPESVTYTQPKIIQKVPTSAPGRFVVFDWGVDLLEIGIKGNTGNLLPDIQTNGIGLTGPIESIVNKIDPGNTTFGAYNKVMSEVNPVVQNILIGNSTYSELLNMSPKYRTFAKLQELYQTFDADNDVLTLEYGEHIYRGYFTTFSFSIESNSPWNWKYDVSFTSLTDLGAKIRKSDEKSPLVDGYIIVG
jgi:hypothetical protein